MTAGRRLTVMQLVPALEAGGVEQSTLEVGAALVAAGHRSIVVSAGGRLVPALLAGGSEHVTLDIGRKSPATLRHVWTLRRLCMRLRPDLVHARSRLPAWIARGALRGLDPRPHWVTSVHGYNSPSRYSRVLVSGERVICVSTGVADWVRRHYPEVPAARLRVVPRGIDPAAFPRGHRPDASWQAAFAADFPQLAGRRLLCLPGRGTRLKNHAAALRLLAAVRAAGIDAALLLLGAAETGRPGYLSGLWTLAAQLGVVGQLAVCAPRADVARVYAASDLVLQLSTQPEAFGRTVLEALAVGTPVAGYAHGGVGELLDALYPAGQVPPGDEAALARTVLTLLAGAPPVPPVRDYTLAAMQAGELAVYAELLGESRP